MHWLKIDPIRMVTVHVKNDRHYYRSGQSNRSWTETSITFAVPKKVLRIFSNSLWPNLNYIYLLCWAFNLITLNYIGIQLYFTEEHPRGNKLSINHYYCTSILLEQHRLAQRVLMLRRNKTLFVIECTYEKLSVQI